MKGSLVVIAALCVIAAAEASSVRFVSVDEEQNGKDKVRRSDVSEGTDQVIQKKVDDVVKNIKDGGELLEKTVKNLDVERSSTGDKTSESAGEDVKKAASSEKSKIHKRDVRGVLERLAKKRMKRLRAEEPSIFNGREILIKYLTMQKAVISKITDSLILAVDKLETDEAEKEALIAVLKTFQHDSEQVYDNTIDSLSESGLPDYPPHPSGPKKLMRADDIPALMTTMNQRNPFALIPFLARLFSGVAGVASVADMANSFGGSRSNMPDISSIIEMIQRILPVGGFPPVSDFA